MNGLLKQAGQSSNKLPPAERTGQAAEGEALNQASPEEEALMEQALDEVGNLIYADDPANNALMNGIASAANPVKMIGINVSQIIEVVDRKMDLPEDFILPLAEPVTMMLIEMADTAGILEASDEVVEQALAESAAGLAQAYELDPQELATYASDPEISQVLPKVGGVYAGQG